MNNWFWQMITTSIGKKLLMALTGLCFVGFLSAHLAGNLTIYGGAKLFNSYSDHLHAYGPLLTLAELALVALALVHIATGTILFFQNLSARPHRYKINKNAGGRTTGSMTMPYTGFLILVFVVWHLLNFHFVDRTGTTIFDIVTQKLSQPFYIAVYVLAMGVVALHIRHGFWSLFQTLGGNHPKYMPLIMGLSLVLAFVFGIGFALIPITIGLTV